MIKREGYHRIKLLGILKICVTVYLAGRSRPIPESHNSIALHGAQNATNEELNLFTIAHASPFSLIRQVTKVTEIIDARPSQHRSLGSSVDVCTYLMVPLVDSNHFTSQRILKDFPIWLLMYTR